MRQACRWRNPVIIGLKMVDMKKLDMLHVWKVSIKLIAPAFFGLKVTVDRSYLLTVVKKKN